MMELWILKVRVETHAVTFQLGREFQPVITSVRTCCSSIAARRHVCQTKPGEENISRHSLLMLWPLPPQTFQVMLSSLPHQLSGFFVNVPFLAVELVIEGPTLPEPIKKSVSSLKAEVVDSFDVKRLTVQADYLAIPDGNLCCGFCFGLPWRRRHR